MSLKHVKPGDKLWLVNNDCRRGPPREVEVCSVGRVWGYLDTWRKTRFSLETGAVDGGECSSPARVYSSEREYDIAVERSRAWERLSRGIREMRRSPIHLTTQDINGICGLLGIPK